MKDQYSRLFGGKTSLKESFSLRGRFEAFCRSDHDVIKAEDPVEKVEFSPCVHGSLSAGAARCKRLQTRFLMENINMSRRQFVQAVYLGFVYLCLARCTNAQTAPPPTIQVEGAAEEEIPLLEEGGNGKGSADVDNVGLMYFVTV